MQIALIAPGFVWIPPKQALNWTERRQGRDISESVSHQAELLSDSWALSSFVLGSVGLRSLQPESCGSEKGTKGKTGPITCFRGEEEGVRSRGGV